MFCNSNIDYQRMKRKGRRGIKEQKENDDKYIQNETVDDDAQLVLDFKNIFKIYPSLLTKEQLIKDYPWYKKYMITILLNKQLT